MGEFGAFFQLGLEHIADITAYDHILFIIALCATYIATEWKQVLILVTAFTIGHSITLVLAALEWIGFNPALIEFLIPVTIFLTSLYNLTQIQGPVQSTVFNRKMNMKYVLALGFGLIHGMGFSNYFKNILGQQENIVKPLFAFNVGIEVGQLIIVAILFIVLAMLYRLIKMQRADWVLFISGATAGLSFVMMLETKFW